MNNHQQKLAISRYRSQGMSIRDIAAQCSITKYRVERIIDQLEQKVKEESKTEQLLAPFREQIIQWAEEKKMPTKLIAKRLMEKKIVVSESSVLRYVRKLKKPETYVHVFSKPAEEGQVDFGYLGLFKKDGKQTKVWVFNMVLSHSRYAFYKIVTNQTAATFFQCHLEAFEFFGGVPRTVKIDNLGAGVLEADFYQPLIQKQYCEFLEHYSTVVLTARICRGQDKGKVEAGIKYVKNSFLKNIENRDFAGLEKSLAEWNKNTCNLRIHGTTRLVPLEAFIKNEKKKLLPLPIHRYEIFAHERRTVNQFGHIYYKYNQYSVPHHYAGEPVTIAVNGKIIKIFKDEQQIAMHVLRHVQGENFTEEKHKPLHKRAKTNEHYRQLMEKIGKHAVNLVEVLIIDRPFEWKKMCNGIYKLLEDYPHYEINEACEAVYNSDVKDYRRVKEVTEKIHKENKQSPVSFKSAGGYAHDLTFYDRFVSVFPS